MPISRRALALFLAPFATAPPIRVLAQATPEASPVAIADPEEIFALLRDTPFSSSLLPEGYGDQEIAVWDDSSDTDLEGAIGGLLIGPVGNPEEAFVAAIIVHADAETARARVMALEDSTDGEHVQSFAMLGIEGLSIVDRDEEWGYATVAVAIGPVIVGGAADVSAFPDDYVLRGTAHLIAALDHVQRVTGITV
jgi:hypothetical protein